MEHIINFVILFLTLVIIYFIVNKSKEGFDIIYAEFIPKEKKEIKMDERAKLEKIINDGFDNYNFGRKSLRY